MLIIIRTLSENDTSSGHNKTPLTMSEIAQNAAKMINL